MLECFRLVKVLHSIEHASHKISPIFLFMQMLSDSVPKLLQSSLLVSRNNLLVPSSQVESYLGALEPFLKGLFGLHVSDILFQGVLLDAERLENAKHLCHRIVALTELVILNATVSSYALYVVDAGHFFLLSSLCLFHHGLSHDELFENGLLRVFSPSEPSFAQIAILKCKEELVCRLDSSII